MKMPVIICRIYNLRQMWIINNDIYHFESVQCSTELILTPNTIYQAQSGPVVYKLSIGVGEFIVIKKR